MRRQRKDITRNFSTFIFMWLQLESGVKVLVAQSCPTHCDRMDCSLQEPLSMEFSRQEYWSGMPFPTLGDLLNPGIKAEPHTSPALAGHKKLVPWSLNEARVGGLGWRGDFVCPLPWLCCVQSTLPLLLALQEWQSVCNFFVSYCS